MKNNGTNTNCPFADEIVSYIYDEITGTQRSMFETHLADCMVCTDEFAAVSNARFSVFEWRKEEFAHLPTPEIVIPYPVKKAVGEENAPVGILAGVRGWLSLVNFPVAVAAALLVTIGLGFLAITYLGGSDQQIANIEVKDPTSPANSQRVILPVQSGARVDIDVPKSQIISDIPHSRNGSDREIHPIKAVESRRVRMERQMTADRVRVQDPALKLRKAPALSNYDDNDDRSLRLADLFDEDGG